MGYDHITQQELKRLATELITSDALSSAVKASFDRHSNENRNTWLASKLGALFNKVPSSTELRTLATTMVNNDAVLASAATDAVLGVISAVAEKIPIPGLSSLLELADNLVLRPKLRAAAMGYADEAVYANEFADRPAFKDPKDAGEAAMRAVKEYQDFAAQLTKLERGFTVRSADDLADFADAVFLLRKQTWEVSKAMLEIQEYFEMMNRNLGRLSGHWKRVRDDAISKSAVLIEQLINKSYEQGRAAARGDASRRKPKLAAAPKPLTANQMEYVRKIPAKDPKTGVTIPPASRQVHLYMLNAWAFGYWDAQSGGQMIEMTTFRAQRI